MSGGDWKEFYQSVLDGRYDLVQYHVQNRIDVNYQHPEILMTALVAAIKNNHTDIAIYLLENGADPKLESYFDQLTPIQAAHKYKNKAVLKKLETIGIFKPRYLDIFSYFKR